MSFLHRVVLRNLAPVLRRGFLFAPGTGWAVATCIRDGWSSSPLAPVPKMAAGPSPAREYAKPPMVAGRGHYCQWHSSVTRTEKASKRKRGSKALPALGAAGLLSLASAGASAVNMPTSSTDSNHEITLSEEEVSDVTLATFCVIDKENTAFALPSVQLVRVGGCGHGCEGCGHGCGIGIACHVGGCGFGCRGFVGCASRLPLWWQRRLHNRLRRLRGQQSASPSIRRGVAGTRHPHLVPFPASSQHQCMRISWQVVLARWRRAY